MLFVKKLYLYGSQKRIEIWHLGKCYQYGIGVGMNDENALVWYEKSAKQGNANAIRSLDKLKTELGLL